MSLRETKAFLQDLVLRFDPEQDISEGSRADAELIQPILRRLGPDPFDETIHVFVRERVRQAFPNRAMTEVDAFTDILIDPMRVLCEPLVRETKLMKLRSSLKNADSLADEEIDALMANFFRPRKAGGFATGVVRAFFSSPQTISVSQPHIASTKSGLQFIPTRPQGITEDQMALNIIGSEYYFDINYTSRNRGDEYNVEANEIVSVANLPTAIRVRNLRRFRNGTPRETNTEYLARVQRGIGDGTLTAERGIISTLEESFPDIQAILVVGFHDPEMERDIVRGGSLGAIPTDDALGAFFGSGTAVDDQDGDLSTQVLEATDGHFVSRVGAAGDEPDSWFVTLFYTDGGSVVVADVQVLEVISDTRVRVDHEIPLSASGLAWALREKKLTISDIPGGITLPDSADGSLQIEDGAVHIGGKDDIYIGGETELKTAAITSLTDESPIAKGYDSLTQGSVVDSEDIVLLADLGVDLDLIEPGMSLVLEEGEDVGSYRILEVITGVDGDPDGVRVDQDMTGTQSGITWKIVDDIDVELTDPKNIKAEGSDMLTAAGAYTVTTSSAFNFLDGDIVEGDILEIDDERGGGEFRITAVTATHLEIEPFTPRTLGEAAWRVFSRSEAVEPPVVRVSSLELLDAVGAPNGTKIPYRDPVLVRSNAFQNEGQGFLYDNLCVTGLVNDGAAAGSPRGVGSTTIEWSLSDPDTLWAVQDPGDSDTFTFSPGSKTHAQIAAEINADVTLDGKGIKATVLTSADGATDYVGFISPRRLTFTGGTALSPLGMSVDSSNSSVRAAAAGAFTFDTARVRVGDALEMVSGANTGVTARVADGPSNLGLEIVISNGPTGPGTLKAAYSAVILAPDVEVRVRIGRPSIGSARVYFLDPTSAELRYDEAEFSTTQDARELTYRPDPENTRQVMPAVPSTELAGGATVSSGALVDTEVDFLSLGVKAGDVLELLYRPITATGPMSGVGNIAVGGKALRVRTGFDNYVSINFPFDMPRQEVVDYINVTMGLDIASLDAGVLVLIADVRLEVDLDGSTAVTSGDPLFLAGTDNTTDHNIAGSYIIAIVESDTLTASPLSPLSGTHPNSYYRIYRYVQRLSSTEMNTQVDASGLYYMDVQLISNGPGDDFNIGAGIDMALGGHVSDGYRLHAENDVLTFSRAEVLFAEISKSILLVGSSDSPEEYVQLSQQNVQVTYDRSALVDAVQSFVDARFNRVVCSEPLARHLLPHYVSMTWNYVGGPAEAEATRALTDYLAAIEVEDGLEVNDLVDAIRRKNATSVYITDTTAPAGRAAPKMVVVYHNVDRTVRAVIVDDVVDTVRTQRFVPGTITLRRVSPGGIR